METLQADPILTFPKGLLNVIRKTYNLDKPGVMDAAIDILELWLKKQDHFITKDFMDFNAMFEQRGSDELRVEQQNEKGQMLADFMERENLIMMNSFLNNPGSRKWTWISPDGRDYLERCIIRSKGSLERAKERLDAMCTAKTFLPELFNDFIMVDSLPDYLLHGILPKLTHDYYRVYVLVNNGQTFSNDIFLKYYHRIIQFVEYTSAHDYSNGFILIEDYRTTNLMELIKSIDISLMGNVYNLLLKSYGTRIKAIHIISGSKVINLFVNIIKQVITEKISNRIHVHSESEMLYEHIEKDILPKDFGGNEKSCKELHELWQDVVSSEEHVKYMKKMNAAKTDESLRRKDESNNQYLGITGTFRSLSVD